MVAVETHGPQSLHAPFARSAGVAHLALVQYVFMLGEQVAAPGTTHGPHPLHRALVSTSPVVVHSLRAQSACIAGVHWVPPGGGGVVGAIMHGPQSLHSARLWSAGVAHRALAQYNRMLGEHVGAPLTTHGPHPLHRVLVSTSPVVVHSLRMQSACAWGVHGAAPGGGGVVAVETHGPQSLHAPFAKSAGVAHLALVQYVFMLGEQVAAPGTTHGPHPLHRALVSTSPVVVHSLRAQSACIAGVHWAPPGGGGVVVGGAVVGHSPAVATTASALEAQHRLRYVTPVVEHTGSQFGEQSTMGWELHSPDDATTAPALAASHGLGYVTPVVEHTGAHTMAHSVVGGAVVGHSPVDATTAPALAASHLLGYVCPKVEHTGSHTMGHSVGGAVVVWHSPDDATTAPALAASHELGYVCPVVEHTGSHTMGHSVVGGGSVWHSPADATTTPALAASHELGYVTPVVEHTGCHTMGHSVVGGGNVGGGSV